MSPEIRHDPEAQLTQVDGLIRLERARHYLLGLYSGAHDENDREAAERVIQPLESLILNDLGQADSGDLVRALKRPENG